MSTLVDPALARSSASPADRDMSLAEARRLVQDLYRPKAWIYWTDFLLSMGIGGVFFALVRRMPYLIVEPLWLQLAAMGVCFVISCLLYYRAVLFIHELVHLRADTFRGFRFVWNLFCGIPFLTPSFTYYTHVDHHRRKHYGTDRDGEYLPLGNRPPWELVVYLLGSFVIAPLAVVRFFVLTPLSWISPTVRSWVHQHASSLVMDPTYIRPLPTARTLRIIRLQEFMCFLWCLGIAVVPPVFLDRWPIPFLIHAYCTGTFIILLNEIRTMGAHRWLNDGHSEMTFREQLLDSVNYPWRPWITGLWGPVGLRYHALHHLFPSLPYHALPEAHRRLMAGLPAGSPYRQTNRVTLTSAIIDVFRRSRQSSANHRQRDADRAAA